MYQLLVFGAVGQGVARVLIDKKEYLEKMGLDFKVVAVADSRSAATDDNGVDLLVLCFPENKMKVL